MKVKNNKLRNLTWTVMGLLMMVVLVTAATVISDTSIKTDNINVTNFVGSRVLTHQGINDVSQVGQTIFALLNKGNVDDGTGARGRTELGFWINEISGPDNRLLSIQAHGNLTQPYHATFYSNLKNNTFDGKAFEWKLNNDTDGIFNLIHLNRIGFPDEYTGFFGDDDANAGLIINDDKFDIRLDSDADGSETEEFAIYNNLSNKIFFVTTANTAFNGTLFQDGISRIAKGGAFYARGGSASFPAFSFSDDSNTGFWRGASDRIDAAVGGNPILIINSDGLTLGNGTAQSNITLTSPDGTEFACGVNDSGGFNCN